ncbi:hypothetical protein QNK09_12025 [Brevibacillus agri]|uniref:hypothetical protein n=1 Tax=Brevibacillus agri TaxID=51101 RepID=UPI0004705AE2|nr:hypothetical protein [Brevibacillus agri]WHX32882.1 hypothetical protein QNK09_12025 [Brevibacillus agri]
MDTLNRNADKTYECKSNSEKHNINKKVTKDEDYSHIIVTEKNKLNPKRMAQVLIAMYEQGVRVTEQTSPTVGDKN